MKATQGRQRIYKKDVAHLRVDRILPVDAKGRIAIGKTEGVTGYRVVQHKGDKIVLQAMTPVPAREAWIYKNKKVLAGILEGFRQSMAGEAGPLPPDLQKLLDRDAREL